MRVIVFVIFLVSACAVVDKDKGMFPAAEKPGAAPESVKNLFLSASADLPPCNDKNPAQLAYLYTEQKLMYCASTLGEWRPAPVAATAGSQGAAGQRGEMGSAGSAGNDGAPGADAKFEHYVECERDIPGLGHAGLHVAYMGNLMILNGHLSPLTSPPTTISRQDFRFLPSDAVGVQLGFDIYMFEFPAKLPGVVTFRRGAKDSWLFAETDCMETLAP